MKTKFHQRILILPVLVLLWSALVPCIANGQDSIVISTTKLDGAGGEKFGSSVAIDGSNLGIGAILADGGADNSGATYLFKITDSNNFPQTKLSWDGTAKTGDRFGNSVDISGDTLVIGAHLMDDGDLSNSGAAYVVNFSYDESQDLWDTEWVELTGDPVENTEFGYAVAISGDVVVVGARKDSEKGLYSGSVYVFRNNGSTWIREAKLYADDAQAQEYFGSSVAIDGDTLVVGATKGGEGDLQTGSVYVFKYNGFDWEEETELFAENLAHKDQFGYSVAIEGDTILVGAPRHDDGEADSGAAYVFRRNAGTWFPKSNLKGSELFEKAYFGTSVSLSGNTAVVGAYRNDLFAADNSVMEDTGSAYVFRFDGSIWPEEEKLIPADAVGGEEFGWAVAISGDTVVVGAHKDGDLSGSVYVYTLNQPPVADAGADQEVEEGSQVTLKGSDSYDLDYDDLQYSWTQIDDGPSVDLYAINETDRTFTAPPWPGENLTLTFELAVNDGRADRDSTDVVEITVLQSTKNVTEITSVLGSEHRPWGIDKDIYTFHGTEGKKVTVTLRAKLGGKNNHGHRATLKLKDNIRSISFYRIDSGRLPNQICATLPATGQYHVLVAGQPRFFRGKRFLGEYTITLEGASGPLEKGAGSSVVPKKSGYSTKPHKKHPIWSWLLNRFRR
jgi:hypothetical protein